MFPTPLFAVHSPSPGSTESLYFSWGHHWVDHFPHWQVPSLQRSTFLWTCCLYSPDPHPLYLQLLFWPLMLAPVPDILQTEHLQRIWGPRFQALFVSHPHNLNSAAYILKPSSVSPQLISCSSSIQSVLVFKVLLFLWLFLPAEGTHRLSSSPLRMMLLPAASLISVSSISSTHCDLGGLHCWWKLSTTGIFHWILTNFSAFDFLSEYARTWNSPTHFLVCSISA